MLDFSFSLAFTCHMQHTASPIISFFYLFNLLLGQLRVILCPSYRGISSWAFLVSLQSKMQWLFYFNLTFRQVNPAYNLCLWPCSNSSTNAFCLGVLQGLILYQDIHFTWTAMLVLAAIPLFVSALVHSG